MVLIRAARPWIAVASLVAVSLSAATNAPAGWIRDVAETGASDRRVPFGEVIHAVTGKRVLPFSTTNAADAEVAAKLGEALGKVLRRMNAPDSPAHRERRINEVSRHFETALREELTSADGLSCAPPRNAAGRAQSSGYPDLRIVHAATGRVYYLDPKVRGPRSRGNSLRTFYYEPRFDTNKVLDDATHLLAGIEHDGAAAGQWTFTRWEIVDLSRVRVGLKAEFQAANRDLYQEATVVGEGRPPEENEPAADGEKKTGVPSPERP